MARKKASLDRQEDAPERTIVPVVFLRGEIKTPPFSRAARIAAGALLTRVQWGDEIPMPHRRPMPSIGPRCAELRVDDGETGKSWRVVYRRDRDLVLVVGIFEKKSQATKRHDVENCKRCLAAYDRAVRESE